VKITTCDDNGGQGIGAGHVCKCVRTAGHPNDSDRPHGCVCGALWGNRVTIPTTSKELPTISTQAEADALAAGAIIVDKQGDAFQKRADMRWGMVGEFGGWSPSWIVYPATLLWVTP